MNPKQSIISTVLVSFNGERSIYGVYHLLKGKKSAQTIQDGTLFSVISYFGIFSKLTRADFEKDIDLLIKQKNAIHLGGNNVILTEKGKEELKSFHLNRPNLIHLNGWHYHAYTEKVWLRLCLLLQSLSHLVGKRSTFYPITYQTDVQLWVKIKIPRHESERRRYLTHLFDEITSFLTTCQDEHALVFVHQLSGTEKIGYTIQQLANQLDRDATDLYLNHIALLHKLFTIVEKDKNKYPYLTLLITDLKQELILTESARQTLSLINKGISIEGISNKRQLKQNTIEDHVIEIALQQPEFSISSFVDKEIEWQIRTIAEELQTSRLRELKEKLPSDVSYFMIRLVLARKKVEK